MVNEPPLKVILQMNRWLPLLSVLLISSLWAIGAPSESRPDLFGDYDGGWTSDVSGTLADKNPMLRGKIIQYDPNLFSLDLIHDFDMRSESWWSAEGSIVDGVLRFQGDGWDVQVQDGVLTGTTTSIGGEGKQVSFRLNRVERLSPTLGMSPPPGAVVLFDGSGFEHWRHNRGDEVLWKLIPGEMAMEVAPTEDVPDGMRDLQTKDEFGSMRLHIEFKTPLDLGRRGQGRGNSGVFLMGFFEVQVLDSYGLVGKWNEAGALYKVAPPMVNMAAPPGQWQTYDIEFTAPVLDIGGNVIKEAMITVYHNGVIIHRDQPIPHRTAWKQEDRDPPTTTRGPIRLQNHSNAVQFRNIWLVETGKGG